MLREMMKSKIHRATITHVDLNYVGSITIDRILMNGANLLPNEKVDVLNVTNGARFSTYVIAGESGSGVIGINGAAARLVSPGDIVIVVAYALVPQEELASFAPSVVFVDEQNCSIMQGDDPLLFSETSRGGLARPAFAEG